MEITLDALLYALDSVVWYNGLGETVTSWAKLEPDENGYISRPRGQEIGEQKEIIWMILVCLFGDYGTSPRSGWIYDIENFRKFVKIITSIYREDEEGDIP